MYYYKQPTCNGACIIYFTLYILASPEGNHDQSRTQHRHVWIVFMQILTLAHFEAGLIDAVEAVSAFEKCWTLPRSNELRTIKALKQTKDEILAPKMLEIEAFKRSKMMTNRETYLEAMRRHLSALSLRRAEVKKQKSKHSKSIHTARMKQVHSALAKALSKGDSSAKTFQHTGSIEEEVLKLLELIDNLDEQMSKARGEMFAFQLQTAGFLEEKV